MFPAVSTDRALSEALERYWGYTSFRPLQREAMDAILVGRDSIVVLPTGGGKSLCFQAPAVVRAGLAVVVSPLISLMKDQVDTLVGNGVPAALYNSSLASETKASVRRRPARRPVPAALRVAGAAGRRRQRQLPQPAVARARSASSPSTKRTASASGGTTFDRSTASSGRLRELLPGHQRARLHGDRDRARAAGHRAAARAGRRRSSSSARSTGRTSSTACWRDRISKRQLLDVLERHRGQAGIIYCTSRREVDALAAWLRESGVRALPYHAGLADAERSRNQDAFLDEDADIIVATVAFGMGIDRSDVRFVVHAGAPQSLEHYQQESGRAGRDGLEAECVLLYSSADFMKWRLMLERNGELTDAAAQAAARHRAIRRERRLPPPAPRHAISATPTPEPTAAPATTVSTSSRRPASRLSSRARSCRASRASASASASPTSPTCCAAATSTRSRRGAITS